MSTISRALLLLMLMAAVGATAQKIANPAQSGGAAADNSQLSAANN